MQCSFVFLLQVPVGDSMEQSEQHCFSLWRDRVLRFDGGPGIHKVLGGEQVIKEVQHVEDAKGNPGVLGSLTLTNLRLMWRATGKRHNISVGYLTIKNMIVKEIEDPMKNEENASSTLVISSRFRSTKYQFLFRLWSKEGTNSNKKGLHSKRYEEEVKERNRLFSLAYSTWKAYENSKPFREVRMRTAVTTNNGMQLLLLPMEKVISQYSLSARFTDSSVFVGRFWLTNVRIVWVQSGKADFNFSIPFIQIVELSLRNNRGEGKVREKSLGKESDERICASEKTEKGALMLHHSATCSLTGMRIVVKTSPHGGDKVVNLFCSSTVETQMVYDEICTLWKFSLVNPVFGVTVSTMNVSDGEEGKISTGGGGNSTERLHPSHNSTADRAVKLSVSSSGRHSASSYMSAATGGLSLEDQNKEGIFSVYSLEEEENIFDEAPSDAFAAYYSPEEDGKCTLEKEKEVFVSNEGEHQELPSEKTKRGRKVGSPECYPTLGLAIEPLRQGVTLEELWKVSVK